MRGGMDWLRGFELVLRNCQFFATSRTHGWVYIARPHTGVPEIGRSIYTQPCREDGGALPVASFTTQLTEPVARDHVCEWDGVCQSTDFWYPSMRAVGIHHPTCEAYITSSLSQQ
jgi:hypothetical protein